MVKIILLVLELVKPVHCPLELLCFLPLQPTLRCSIHCVPSIKDWSIKLNNSLDCNSTPCTEQRQHLSLSSHLGKLLSRGRGQRQGSVVEAVVGCHAVTVRLKCSTFSVLGSWDGLGNAWGNVFNLSLTLSLPFGEGTTTLGLPPTERIESSLL